MLGFSVIHPANQRVLNESFSAYKNPFNSNYTKDIFVYANFSTYCSFFRD